MTDDLVSWLRAQIADDEEWANEIGERSWEEERFGPARLLAEVQAKRAILDEHRAYDFANNGDPVCGTCMRLAKLPDEGFKFEAAPCKTVRLLAAVFSDRPGYREV